jgi:mannosyltransferase OCH1-like enzyme
MNYKILILIILFIIFNILNIYHKKKEHFKNKKNYVWLYWEDKPGTTKSDYLNMCLDTFKKHLKDYEVIVLNPKNINNYLSNVNPNFNKIKTLAHKADYVRMLATYQHGGFWFDSDTVVMNNIDEWNEKLKTHGIVFYGMSTFGVQKHNPFVKDVLDKIEKKIYRSKTFSFHWREIGQDIIDPALERYKKNYPNMFYKIPENNIFFLPFNHDNNRTGLLSRNEKTFNKFYNDNLKIVILHNQIYPHSFKKMTREEILKDDMLISRLFNISLV